MQPASHFAALADPTRCRVIELLHERPRPVHELAAAFSISRPAISRHLRVLKNAELVHEEKQGRENIYSLRRHHLRPLADWLNRHWNLRLATKDQVPGTPQMEFDL
jgi:DNA-binding transcriptional ArsR family regulator